MLRLILLIFSFSLLAVAKPTKKVPVIAQTHSINTGKYLQHQTGDEPADETLDMEFSSAFIFPQFRFSSILYYSYNQTTPKSSGWEDPIFTLGTISKNFIPQAKIRYYVVSTLGASNFARDVQEQYGSLGAGIGLKLDTQYLNWLGWDIWGSFSTSKSFQKREFDVNGKSNTNIGTITTGAISYAYKKWSFSTLGMFYQNFKYVNDESTEQFYQYQDIGYDITPQHGVGAGHSNLMGFYDESSGEVNVRVVNTGTSYFYVRYTFTFSL